jgi:hypothetical protein
MLLSVMVLDTRRSYDECRACFVMLCVVGSRIMENGGTLFTSYAGCRNLDFMLSVVMLNVKTSSVVAPFRLRFNEWSR